MNIQEKKKQRFEFLSKLYEVSNGSSSFQAMTNSKEIAKELNLSREIIDDIVDYLEAEGLLEMKTEEGGVIITHKGIIEIEEAFEKPEKPTEHFPPIINFIHVGSMYNSAIQQGSTESNQTVIFNKQEQTDLRELIHKLEALKEGLKSDEQLYSEFIAEVDTLKAQNNSTKPKRLIIKESLKSIRTILEGISVNIATPEILELISNFLK